MNDASSFKSNKIGTPKTPGGISKSLLTPCRRLGLSRNWKKSGPSPFISPLSGSGEVKHEKTETRKRKECVINEETPTTPIGEEDEGRVENIDIDRTPSRNVDLPRRKKSKTLLSALTISDNCTESTYNIETQSTSKHPKEELKANTDSQNENISASEIISTPVRSKAVKSKKNVSPLKSISKEKDIKQCQINDLEIKENLTNNPKLKDTKPKEVIENREKSPQNLTKECIVVIQNKLFKKEIKEAVENKVCIKNIPTNKGHNSVSQVLFDSDSDDVPLSSINKKEIQNVMKPFNSIDEDDDFANKTSKKKLESNKPLNVNINSKSKSKAKVVPSMVRNTEASRTLLQSSIDDDEDFDFENKKTILIKKTYKIPKLLKAKSTGSITQKDIDELKVRIEAKKKLLLAKAMTEDTKELRDLIKKWQKGCQDALMELMDLMKTKLPDKHNMDYSEILETLKIPASLVGYDSENDCFNTPDDANIILAKFNDL